MIWELIVGGAIVGINLALKGGYSSSSSIKDDGFSKTVKTESKNAMESIAKGVEISKEEYEKEIERSRKKREKELERNRGE